MKITIEEALIKTATVDIKTLTIEGRQVTLAVFRQLQKEDVVDCDIRLNGPVWGQVNYHPDPECKSLGNHIHLVWQSGTELRRSLVTASCPRKALDDFNESINNASMNLLAALALKGSHFKKDYYSNPFRFSMGDISLSVWWNSDDLVKRLLESNYRFSQGDKFYNQEMMTVVKEKYNMSEDEAKAQVIKLYAERAAYQKDWKTLYEKLKNVQQLFIAV